MKVQNENAKHTSQKEIVISPFISIFKFNAVIFVSFSHRVAEMLTFTILCTGITAYGILGLAEKYPILKHLCQIITHTTQKLPWGIVSFSCINAIFYYSITELRFAMLELKLLPMDQKTMTISAYATLGAWFVFLVFSAIMFLM